MKSEIVIPVRFSGPFNDSKMFTPLCGLSLYKYTLAVALDNNLPVVFLTSDVDFIAYIDDLYSNCGLVSCYLLNTDVTEKDATAEAAFLTYISELAQTYSQKNLPDSFIYMQCTEPIRERGLLPNMLTFYERSSIDCLFAAQEFHKIVWSRNKGPLTNIDRVNRQQLGNKFFREDSGVASIISTEALLDDQNISKIPDDQVYAVMPYFYKSPFIDIHGPADFIMAESILSAEDKSLIDLNIYTPSQVARIITENEN